MNWNNVTLRTYLNIVSLESDATLSSLERRMLTLAYLKDVDLEEIENLPLNQLEGLLNEIAFFAEHPTDADPLITFDVTIDGRTQKYGLTNIQHLVTGQMFDLEALLPNVSMNLHKVIATLYRPVKSSTNIFGFNKNNYELDKYNSNTAAQLADWVLDHLTMDVVYPTLLFFWSIVSNCLQDLTSDLNLNNQKISKTQKFLRMMKQRLSNRRLSNQ